MKMYKKFEPELIDTIKSGGVGVLPTDTLYGLVGSALREDAVERIYQLRQRDLNKPPIILISSLADLEFFGIVLDDEVREKIADFWPGQVSVILPCASEKFQYLQRGQNSLAFRWPDRSDLLELLDKAGPLVAPSANIEGLAPARTITEAQNYFGEQIDFYVDQGEIDSPPSTIVRIEDGELRVVREGAVEIKE
ncbi:MAG: L-threonylcarbamoyladenylate synthase [Candidatus Moranbacteria bacterium]|nr:L-threonylcarbamoyladenylate synthase [Candidatus Moranbacteria bacterium]